MRKQHGLYHEMITTCYFDAAMKVGREDYRFGLLYLRIQYWKVAARQPIIRLPELPSNIPWWSV